jgi:hypothetical protein
MFASLCLARKIEPLTSSDMWTGRSGARSGLRTQPRTLPYDKHLKVTWFEASAPMLIKSVVFWVITRRHVVIIYRRFLFGILTREDGTDTMSRNVGK